MDMLMSVNKHLDYSKLANCWPHLTCSSIIHPWHQTSFYTPLWPLVIRVYRSLSLTRLPLCGTARKLRSKRTVCPAKMHVARGEGGIYVSLIQYMWWYGLKQREKGCRQSRGVGGAQTLCRKFRCETIGYFFNHIYIWYMIQNWKVYHIAFYHISASSNILSYYSLSYFPKY